MSSDNLIEPVANLPKFLLADNSKYPDDVFIVHTAYPRFVMNMISEEVFWLEDFSDEDIGILGEEAEQIISLAVKFYDQEISTYNDD